MTGLIVLFGLATLGSKVLLGLAMVYLFLPDSDRCCRCDGLTAGLQSPRGLRRIAAWMRVQSRWCPHCGERFLARRRRPPLLWVGEAASPPDHPVTVHSRMLSRTVPPK